MKPELSIVIAVRDNWRQISQCLDSLVVQQEGVSFEVVVIDDGSGTPPPPELARRFDGVLLRLKRQIGLGIAAARNRGIALSKGEMILFLDSDCLIAQNCLQNLMAAAHRYVDEVAFQLTLASPRTTLVQSIEALRLYAVQESLLAKSGHISYVNTSGFAVRASYARKNEPLFNVAVIRGEDSLLLARLAGQGFRPRFLPSCRVNHCPKMPFHNYALKHFWIGYHCYYARRQLALAGNILMSRDQRSQMLSRIKLVSHHGKWSHVHVAGTLLCYGIERLGRAASRVIGVLPGKKKILSLNIDVVRESELINRIVAQAEGKRGLWVSYANAWTLVQAQKSINFRKLLNSTDICFLDGVGAMAAFTALYLKGARRATPNNFILDLCKELAERNLTLALIGSREHVMRETGELVERAVPNLKIVLRSAGFFSAAGEESLKAELLEREPNVVLIGMGQPRQEEWVRKLRAQMPATVFFCVGGLFDYLVGPRKCADFARRLGLEWAFRLCRSPRQLAYRYLFGIPALFGYVLMEHAASVQNHLCRWANSGQPSGAQAILSPEHVQDVPDGDGLSYRREQIGDSTPKQAASIRPETRRIRTTWICR